MRALRGVIVLVLALALSASVLAADFQDGWEAYKHGDYKTALKEWRLLAEQGDAAAQHLMRTDALPRLDDKAVAAHIDQLSRDPFRDVLKRLLEAEPSVEAVKQYGERQPERWGQLVTMIARLAGFSDKLEVDHGSSHAVAISQMSDMELMQRLQTVMQKLGIDSDQLPDMRKLRLVANGKSDAGE